MTSEQKLNFKKRLFQKAITIIEQRIATTATAMQNAQDAANEEEKSSAGDKYETSRAMSHLEKDMFAKQAEENKKELAFLGTINYEQLYDVVVAGSFIRCNDCAFFIAAGLGKIIFEEETIFLLSPNAPLAKLFYNKKEGDPVQFNKKQEFIIELF
ncbi:MAG: hypothetical protein QM737_22365 [Ferruginibacter sp.]